jgi:hypothetical protein
MKNNNLPNRVQALPEHFTDINNNNYNNYNNYENNNNNFNICGSTNNKPASLTPSGSSGLASLPRPTGSPGVPQGGQVGMPAEWRGVKFDLFHNGYRGQKLDASLKMAISIIKQDRGRQHLMANLNSPPDYVFRGVDESDIDNPHWQLVKLILSEHIKSDIPFRASKCVLKNRAGTTSLVLFLCEQDHDWVITIVRNGEYYCFDLLKHSELSQAQRSQNIIRTAFFGRGQTPIIKPEDLGI